jgi:hypothetical protein
MGIILSFFYLLWILLGVFVFTIGGRTVKDKIAVLVFFTIVPTYDIIITNLLSAYYCCYTPPIPKTKIIKKVEYPISIYWEDNIYPGFNKKDRINMILRYLDGEHIKTIALNAPDGKHIYLYHLEKPIWDTFKKSFEDNLEKYPVKKELRSMRDFNVYKAFAKEIMKSEKIYTKDLLPKLNYRVTFNEVKLNDFASKFLYSDETKIIDNSTGEVIAYNRRYARFFYNIFPDFVLGNRYYCKVMCGYEFYGYFAEKVLSFNTPLERRFVDIHDIGLSKHLYKKYVEKNKTSNLIEFKDRDVIDREKDLIKLANIYLTEYKKYYEEHNRSLSKDDFVKAGVIDNLDIYQDTNITLSTDKRSYIVSSYIEDEDTRKKYLKYSMFKTNAFNLRCDDFSKICQRNIYIDENIFKKANY